MYSYFSIVFLKCIVNLVQSFNGVKLFQYTINNLYSNSRIRQSSKKQYEYTLQNSVFWKSTLNILEICSQSTKKLSR